MSLFERIKNKRYDLQERKKKFDPNPLIKAINKQSESDAAKDFKKDVGTDVTKEVKKDLNRKIDNNNRFFTDQPDSKTLNTKSTGAADEKVFKRTPEAQKAADAASKEARSISSKLDPSENKFVRKKRIVKNPIKNTVGVNQADVSKKSKKFTDKINKQNKNLNRFVEPDDRPTGEVKTKPKKPKTTRANYPKTRNELIAKRKEYGIDRKGNISDAGVKRYAQKTKQLSSGSNVPAKVTAKDLKVAKIRAVGGEKIKDSTGKVVGTTTGKYGGRLARTRKPTKTIAQLKKEIELKDLNKAANYRAAATARSAELKDLTKKMGHKELAQRISQAAKLRTIRPQRQFYKGVMKPARSITKVLGAKQVAPAVKTGLKLATKAGPAGAVVAGTGIALLNPTIRAGAKKVAKAALGAAGIAAFAPKPKKMKIPKPTVIKIGLSSGKSK